MTDLADPPRLRVDVWSDVVCPWCHIGLANLDAALAELDGADRVDVVLHSFQLDPRARSTTPDEHVEAIARKYGSTADVVRGQQARMAQLGAEVGLDLHFDRVRGANTFDAHRLLHLADRHGRARELKAAMLRAVFTDGEAIDDHAVLRRLAVGVGLEGDEVDSVLAGDAHADEVAADVAAARDLDVTGVPAFLVDRRLMLPGAQPPHVIARVLRRALDEADEQAALLGADAALGDCGPEGCAI
ncbi:MAG: DsbA family oxidoreductase [Acidimicrobiales bacterium]|nr:DsbA family oxidoreductase [Acidimicrobiales bacterium]